MLQAYRAHEAERAALGIPPLPLDAKQTAELIELIKNPPAGEEAFLVDLLTHRVPAGVDDAAKVKASYLAAIALGTETCALISRERATELLGTMLGGYNISPAISPTATSIPAWRNSAKPPPSTSGNGSPMAATTPATPASVNVSAPRSERH